MPSHMTNNSNYNKFIFQYVKIFIADSYYRIKL